MFHISRLLVFTKDMVLMSCSVPIVDSAYRSVKFLPHGTLKVYPGAPHALPNIYIDELNQDLLEFIKS